MDSKNVFLILRLLAMVLVISSEVSARKLTETSTNAREHVVEKINVHNHGHKGSFGHGGHGHGGLGHGVAASAFDGGSYSQGYSGYGRHGVAVFGHGHGHGHGHSHGHGHGHGVFSNHGH